MLSQKQTPCEDENIRHENTAYVIFDSLLSSLPSGVRGMGHDRHLVFAGPDLDIHVKITEVNRRKEMYGQLIWHTPTDQSVMIRLINGETRRETEPGPLGEFSFDEISARSVSLEIVLPFQRVIAAFDA